MVRQILLDLHLILVLSDGRIRGLGFSFSLIELYWIQLVLPLKSDDQIVRPESIFHVIQSQSNDVLN